MNIVVKIGRTEQLSVYEVGVGFSLARFNKLPTGFPHFIQFATEELSRCGLSISSKADIVFWEERQSPYAILFISDGQGFVVSKSPIIEGADYLIGNPRGRRRLPKEKQEGKRRGENIDLDVFYDSLLEEAARASRRISRKERRLER